MRGAWFTNAPSAVVEDQLTSLSDVRPQLAALHQLRLYGKWNFIDAASEVLPMQVDPDNTGFPIWLGAEATKEEEVHDANVFTVLNSDELLKKENNRYRTSAGLVIDFWVEKIPYRKQTAALAFSFDQPDAEPPEHPAVLLDEGEEALPDVLDGIFVYLSPERDHESQLLLFREALESSAQHLRNRWIFQLSGADLLLDRRVVPRRDHPDLPALSGHFVLFPSHAVCDAGRPHSAGLPEPAQRVRSQDSFPAEHPDVLPALLRRHAV